jgi:hypothetical protein
MTTDYNTTLYALGAVPLSAIAREFRSDETDRAVYLKGERVDVNGWLSPYWVKSDQFLTGAERDRYVTPRQPLTYAEYAALLNVDEYKRTKNPQQYAVMAFVLETMLQEGITIENPEDIIKVYEVDVGLDDRVLPLLKDRLNSERAMQLYQKRRDARLLDVFPVPSPEEENYIQFLHTMVEREPDKGWNALRLLYIMDKTRYKEEFRDFTIRRVRETDSWVERLPLYRTLVEVGDEKSIQSLAKSLLSDPVTEDREAIIRTALAVNVYSKELVDSVVQLAKGLGDKHESVTPSRMADQWQLTLHEYLAWVKDNNFCDAASQNDVDEALELLKR